MILMKKSAIKPKIAVIFGGCSAEHDISLLSAYSVVTHMDKEKYDPVLIGITRAGEWLLFDGEYEKIKSGTWHNPDDCTRAIISPDRAAKGVLVFGKDGTHTIRLDAALPMLHGKNGEDGTVQGLLELAGIPLAGCGTLASALCMDKDKAHKIAGLAGVRVPKSFVLHSDYEMEFAFAEAEKIGYPLYVKPVNGGSSFGITKVSARKNLQDAVKLAFEHDSTVIAEESIDGFEVGCAVLGNNNLIVGEVDEIELADGSDGFFGYEEKCTLKTSKIHLPARISVQKADEIKETAEVIYRTLGCGGFARVDMFLTPSGEIVFNEVNTIPGFMPHSRYPNSLKAIGMTLEQIIDAIIKQAVNI